MLYPRISGHKNDLLLYVYKHRHVNKKNALNILARDAWYTTRNNTRFFYVVYLRKFNS